MKSRDEISDAIKVEGFSTRRVFFAALDKCVEAKLGIEGLKPAWPDALNLLTVGDWNDAFSIAMAAKAARAARSAEGSR